jgi:RNA polymerase sigma factor (sigma-70 family)
MQNASLGDRGAYFVENYMEKLFYFCLRKTGDSDRAADLTQDTALHILTALQSGQHVENFSAWVWQIAHNRYARWAAIRRRERESMTGIDIEEYELEDENENPAQQLLHAEQLALLRRELAFVRSEYRDLLVAYYLEDRSVRDIATSLNLSVAAVQQRLHRARNLLKEGMDMAREFGIRSYKPEEIRFAKNGRDGELGQPWTIVNHLLYKNIFLQAHENPQTAEELALELGIALPYMEDELEFLVREQLLRKEGNKYVTDFRIISREEQHGVHEASLAAQKPLTAKICEMIDLYIGENPAETNISYVGYENAKWALLMRTFDVLKHLAGEARGEKHDYSNPPRPDGGAWTLHGYQIIDWEEPGFVGQHGNNYPKPDGDGTVGFWQFKFFYRQMLHNTPAYLGTEEAYNLWLICVGKSEECKQEYVDKLLEYGYIKTVDGVLTPNVLVFYSYAEAVCDAEAAVKLAALKQEIFDLFAKAPSIERGYVLEQAIENGWLTYDENTDKAVGAYINL